VDEFEQSVKAKHVAGTYEYEHQTDFMAQQVEAYLDAETMARIARET
jgi:hypothetical protein